MNLKHTVLVLILGAASLGAMSATANAQPVRDPAKQEVLARVHHQSHDVRVAERTGKISPRKAHRLLAADHRIARHVRMHRGHLTRVEARRLNHQENRIHRHIHS
ncbi:hypothetical protein [Phenylobacterium sp.]|uniref:hypothetical protein n=1 Tax=Phenylobacterium sp. TaxID=1871053 RepID=UPI00286D4AB7|nr:hypothetical protein [Phenylobacterium sp.]